MKTKDAILVATLALAVAGYVYIEAALDDLEAHVDRKFEQAREESWFI